MRIRSTGYGDPYVNYVTDFGSSLVIITYKLFLSFSLHLAGDAKSPNISFYKTNGLLTSN